MRNNFSCIIIPRSSTLCSRCAMYQNDIKCIRLAISSCFSEEVKIVQEMYVSLILIDPKMITKFQLVFSGSVHQLRYYLKTQKGSKILSNTALQYCQEDITLNTFVVVLFCFAFLVSVQSSHKRRHSTFWIQSFIIYGQKSFCRFTQMPKL